MLNEKYDWLKKFYSKYINHKFNTFNTFNLIKNLKIIDNSKDNNKDEYLNLRKHMMILDNFYKILINICFIIVISILLR